MFVRPIVNTFSQVVAKDDRSNKSLFSPVSYDYLFLSVTRDKGTGTSVEIVPTSHALCGRKK